MALTQMMEQYLRIKNENKHSLVFFRLGDFYELFFDDAIIASRELSIVLTGRECGLAERAPMCGIPYHSAENYIARLIDKGYKVAVCEQTENPKQTKTLVKREVVRIVTPGTVTDQRSLAEGRNNYIAAVYEGKKDFGLCLCDVTTGEMFGLQFGAGMENRLIDELARFMPREIIANTELKPSGKIEALCGLKIHVSDEWPFIYENAVKNTVQYFGVHSLDGFGVTDERAFISAASGLLDYLRYTQKTALPHISKLRLLHNGEFMIIDAASWRNLELCDSPAGKAATLLKVLNHTKTPMGARMLRKWLEQPLTDIRAIEDRLDAVDALRHTRTVHEELREYLGTIHDMERLCGKLSYATADARDLNTLRDSFACLPSIKNLTRGLGGTLITQTAEALPDLSDIQKAITDTIADQPPAGIKEGGFIRDGVNAELDECRSAKSNGTTWLLDLERREKTLSGIKNLKIKYNKVFGYFIEITNANLTGVPERYVRRQTLSNCERFVTDELKEIEDKILNAEERIADIEHGLFMDLREKLFRDIPRIQRAANCAAVLDALSSLAETSIRNSYCRPNMNAEGRIDIRGGRHPVVELQKDMNFIANDTRMDMLSDRLLIITGPNMAGKSTYMRQTALIVIMAQIGSFVPADAADVGVCDRVFTRVGASDDLATGKSTFMVEMNEVANILNNATSRSLLILDEIGRGTSTYDGLSIAWAVLEHIGDEDKLGARALFSTHYHELTELEQSLPCVKNYSVTVKEQGDDIVFLRKIARGGADGSFGIQVAKLAGLPGSVIDRSKQILSELKRSDIAVKHSPTVPAVCEDPNEPEESVLPEGADYPAQLRREQSNPAKIIFHDLGITDVDDLSPKQAWDILARLAKKAGE